MQKIFNTWVGTALKNLKIKNAYLMFCKYSEIQYKKDISSLLFQYLPVELSRLNR